MTVVCGHSYYAYKKFNKTVKNYHSYFIDIFLEINYNYTIITHVKRRTIK